MKILAIIAVVLIFALVIGLQHLFNYWIRQDIDGSPLPVAGWLGIGASIGVTAATILKVIEVF